MSDNFWKPYRESDKRYFPAITNARWVKRYQIGAYQALVGTDCDSIGLVGYFHVMYVYEGNEGQPCLAVASEYAREMSSNDAPFFCLFFGGTHFNKGASQEYKDLEIFTQKALETIIQPLELVSETPKELPLN